MNISVNFHLGEDTEVKARDHDDFITITLDNGDGGVTIFGTLGELANLQHSIADVLCQVRDNRIIGKDA